MNEQNQVSVERSPVIPEIGLPRLGEVWQQTLQWQPSDGQQRLFQSLYEAIVAGNRQLNLTRIVEPLEFWEKHLWDSLAGIIQPGIGAQFGGGKIIDIGTGAGFPGLPVAIAFPNSSVTLLDSTRKKIHFLDELVAQLEIANATTLVGRAEQINRTIVHYQAYDLALVRAIGKAPLCAQYALPLLRSGGTAVLYRGRWSEEEREQLQPVVRELGGAIAAVEGFTSPLTQGTRHCIYLKKI